MVSKHTSTSNHTDDQSESSISKAREQELIGPADIASPLQMLDQALSVIREQQRVLKQLQDSGYDSKLIQQQLDVLTNIHAQTQKLINHSPQLLSETVANLRPKSEAIQTLLDQCSQYFDTYTITVNYLTVRKHLYEIISHLNIIVEQLSFEIINLMADSEALPETDSELFSLAATVDKLRADLAHEKRTVLIGDFGQSQKSLILKKLHQFSLLLWRMRQLSYQPRMAKQKDILSLMAIQVKDAVDSLDLQASNTSELLEETAYVIQRQIHRYEYNRYGLPVGWLMNRYQDVKRLQSVQSRVLTGLILSLILSGGLFFVGTVMLMILSAYESASETSIRNNIDTQRKNLISTVEAFLDNETALETKQTQLDNLNTQIEQKPNRVIEFRSERSELSSTALTTIPSESTDDEADAVEQSQSQNSDSAALAIERENLVQQKAELELKRQTMRSNIKQILAELQSLQSQLARQTNVSSLDPTWTGRSLKAAASFVNNKNLLNHLRRIILAAFAGAIGSMMSILIRLDKLDEENIKNPFLLGMLKPIIGAVFGIAVFAILSTRVIDILPSNFYLYERLPTGQGGDASAPNPTQTTFIAPGTDPLGDIDSQELYKIFLVAFIAGFSERLASDTLKSVSSKQVL